MPIHPTAVVSGDAHVDPNAQIGAHVVIEGPVRIGPETIVNPFVHISGSTTIGANCRIHSGAVIGDLPQDRAYAGGESFCEVGDETIIREGVTVHRGTKPGSSTVVGKRCFLMANSHVGHNCVLADDVILTNGALLGGYVTVGPRAFVSGNVAIHQFVRVGELAMIGGTAKITRDIPPFFMADVGGSCVGVNIVGMRRAEFPPEVRDEIRAAYRLYYREGGSEEEKLAAIESMLKSDAGRRLLEFLRGESKRGITGGSSRRSADSDA